MSLRVLDGPAAVALGALAGGCLDALVTPEAVPTRYAQGLTSWFPALGGRCRTLDLQHAGAGGPGPGVPVAAPDVLTADAAVAGAPAPHAAPAPGPWLWLCTGDQLPLLLPLIGPAAGGLLLVCLPPSPGLGAVLSDPSFRWVWSPGSCRMGYRLAAAGCRAAGAGRGPGLLLLDGELPPETVAIPADQVPGQVAPTPRTATEGGDVGTTPVPDRADLAAALVAAPIPEDLAPFHLAGPADPDLLLVGTGTSFGELARAQTELTGAGQAAAHMHLRQIRPFPAEAGAVWRRARRHLVVEPPGGGLAALVTGALGLAAAPPVVPHLGGLGAALGHAETDRPVVR